MIQKFTALAISLTIFSCVYTQKSDSIRTTKNQIGLIVSPAFNIYSNKKYFSDLRLGIIYRRELEKYNLRFSLNAIQNTNDQLLNNPNITIATEYIADTFLIKRIASSYSGEVDFRLGVEKTILNKKIDLIIGADLSIGLLTKNKFYNSSFEFYNTDT